MADLIGNLLVAQSGGPTAVINSSIAGIITEAGKYECIEEIYGGLNGIYGILREEVIDLNVEKARTIVGLRSTPAAALGTCRYNIDFKNKPEQAAKDMDRLFEVFQAHNIRYFCYTGGNDSQETSLIIHEQAAQRGYELRVIGVPKTIDNDLPHTDTCPGYGSVAKYNATTVMEIGADVGSMATDDGACCLIEVMGRSTGWIAAGAVLAKRNPNDPPHIILLPELPFREDAFLAKVKETIDRLHYCIVVVGEGLKNEQGEEMGVDKSILDSFGHPLLSGAAKRLAEIVQRRLSTKTRTVKLGYAQRSAIHFASAVDAEQAFACGEAAVKAAVSGQSGFMVKIVRLEGQPYKWETGLHDLKEVVNVERTVPRDWIDEDGFLPGEKFIQYARPLIEGEIKIPTEGGVPKFVALERSPVEKKLPAYP